MGTDGGSVAQSNGGDEAADLYAREEYASVDRRRKEFQRKRQQSKLILENLTARKSPSVSEESGGFAPFLSETAKHIPKSPSEIYLSRDAFRSVLVDAAADDLSLAQSHQSYLPSIYFTPKTSRNDRMLSKIVTLLVLISVLFPMVWWMVDQDGLDRFILLFLVLGFFLLFGAAVLGPWNGTSPAALRCNRTSTLVYLLRGPLRGGSQTERNQDKEGGRTFVLEEHLGWVDRLKTILAERNRGVAYELCQLVISIFATIQYVYYTYATEVDPTKEGEYIYPNQQLLYNAWSVAFALDYLLRLTFAADRLAFVVQRDSIADWISFNHLMWLIFKFMWPDDFGIRPSSILTLGALRFLRLSRIIRIVQIYKLTGSNDLTLQVVSMLISGVLILCTTAGIILGLEYYNSEEELRNYHTCLYFTVVTLTTVGYGDMKPESTAGRMIIMVVITGSILVFIPLQTSKFGQIAALRSAYVGSVPASGRHVVLTGNLTKENILSFVTEFFHEDHPTGALNLVLISNEEPSLDVRRLLQMPLLRDRVMYRVGSVTSPSHCEKYKVTTAVACFILSDKFTTSPRLEDKRSVHQVLALKRFRPELTLFIQLFSTTHKEYISSVLGTHDKVICFDEIGLKIMAYSCICPGFSTFIVNVLNSTKSVTTDEPWLKEYSSGAEQELYKFSFHESFVGLRFSVAALIIYQKFGIVLFALKTRLVRKDSTRASSAPLVAKFLLYLNPSTTISRNDVGYVLAPDSSFADEISNCSLTEEEQQSALSGVSSSTTSTPDQTPGSMHNRSPSRKGSTTIRKTRGKFHDTLDAPAELPFKDMPIRAFVDVAPIVSPLESCLRDAVPNDESGHIVVIGFHSNLHHFIMPLRFRDVTVQKSIVILTPRIPTRRQWSRVGVFNGLVLIQGSGSRRADLLRAGVTRASQFVVLHENSSEMDGLDHSLMDIDSLVVLQKLPEIREHFFLSQIYSTDSLSLISGIQSTHVDGHVADKTEMSWKLGPHYEDSFISGNSFSDPMLSSLISQYFFNGDLSTILEAFLTPFSSESLEDESHGLSLSSLVTIPCPEEFEGKTYAGLFEHLVMQQEIMPLSLYRTNPLGQKYVYSNPAPNCRLRTDDMVMVLGHSNYNQSHPVVQTDGSKVSRTDMFEDTMMLPEETQLTRPYLDRTQSNGNLDVSNFGARLDKLELNMESRLHRLETMLTTLLDTSGRGTGGGSGGGGGGGGVLDSGLAHTSRRSIPEVESPQASVIHSPRNSISQSFTGPIIQELPKSDPVVVTTPTLPRKTSFTSDVHIMTTSHHLQQELRTQQPQELPTQPASFGSNFLVEDSGRFRFT